MFQYLLLLCMARKDIHPELNDCKIEIFNKDGSKKQIECRTTSKTDLIVAEVNIWKHPAWKEDNVFDSANSINQNLLKFTKKFNYGNK